MTPRLATANLAVGYGRRIVLQGLDLTVPGGTLVCLVGANGAGKSTLLRTLAGLQPPLAGEVRLDGAPLAALAPTERARKLAVVLTERVSAGALDVYSLVALGRHPWTGRLGTLEPADRAAVAAALDTVGIAALAARRFDELSDGERQKTLLARALAQQPSILLLDEPASFLDVPRQMELIQLLRGLTRGEGRAVVLSTHHVDLALRSADVLWLLGADGVAHCGAPEDLPLTGVVQAAFAGPAVTFDPATVTFQPREPNLRPAAVRGVGEPARWATHVLRRLGFDGAAAASDGPVVTLMGAGAQWRATWADAAGDGAHYAELAVWLRAHDPARPAGASEGK